MIDRLHADAQGGRTFALCGITNAIPFHKHLILVRGFSPFSIPQNQALTRCDFARFLERTRFTCSSTKRHPAPGPGAV